MLAHGNGLSSSTQKFKWTKRQCLILLDYYIRFTEREFTRQQAEINASFELRQDGYNTGLAINKAYCSSDGIHMQMMKMEDVFLERPVRLSKPPVFFTETCQLYKTNRNQFYQQLRRVRQDSLKAKENIEGFHHLILISVNPQEAKDFMSITSAVADADRKLFSAESPFFSYEKSSQINELKPDILHDLELRLTDSPDEMALVENYLNAYSLYLDLKSTLSSPMYAV